MVVRTVLCAVKLTSGQAAQGTDLIWRVRLSFCGAKFTALPLENHKFWQ